MSVLEVGLGRGRTAVALAECGAQVWGVSLWDEPDEGTRAEFTDNVQAAGVTVKAVQMDSVAFADMARGRLALDVVFIDGGHEYPQVKADLAGYSELLKPGGVLILHDVGTYHPGVDAAASEITWEKIGQVWSTAAWRVSA